MSWVSAGVGVSISVDVKLGEIVHSHNQVAGMSSLLVVSVTFGSDLGGRHGVEHVRA